MLPCYGFELKHSITLIELYDLKPRKNPLNELLELGPDENNQRINGFIEKIENLKKIIYDEVESMRDHPADLEMDFGIIIQENQNQAE